MCSPPEQLEINQEHVSWQDLNTVVRWLGVLLEAAGMSALSQRAGIGVMIMKIIWQNQQHINQRRYIHLAESALLPTPCVPNPLDAKRWAAPTCKLRQLR